jgi:hypothetical protein
MNNVPLPLVSESSDANRSNDFSSQSNATASGSVVMVTVESATRVAQAAVVEVIMVEVQGVAMKKRGIIVEAIQIRMKTTWLLSRLLQLVNQCWV